ncbi:MAG TPA: tripartite tricarboxylate transporter substrate-binding protein [Burkholderiales bacterium]|nr:tripartite tricarboxylate transporter substrate-binding protein [Burkholderiales bacterium]
MFAACKPYRVLLSSIAIALCPAASFAQPAGLPSKQIRIVVPNAAAGPNDLVARVIGPKLSETIGHPVVVENRPSPNGVIGSEYVARAVADGTVLAVGNSGTHAVNATLYRNPTYDPVKDFAAISEVIFGSLVLVAHPSVKANNVRELIAEAKRAPGKLNIAVAGATGEIAGNLIKMQGKIDLTNIPYKGGTPAVAAVMANESQLLLTLYSSLKGPIDSGKLKPIGVTGARRIPQLPNTPTVAESGLEGYEVEFWVGVFAPAKTPAATVQALGREIARIVNLPDVKERFTTVSFEVIGSMPETFAERVRRDTEKYRKIILESGMQQLD